MAARGTSSSGRSQRRPSRVDARGGHRGETVRPRAAQQLQQQRFGLVVAMMREQDRGRAGLLRGRGEGVVARARAPTPRRWRAASAAPTRGARRTAIAYVAHSAAQCADHASALGESP